MIVKEYGDIYYKYEISDDFKQVRIYEASGNIDRQRRDQINLDRIHSLVALYHSIKENRTASIPTTFTINIIEPSS